MSLIKVDPARLAQLQDEQARAERADAYREESDPLFFAYQAGEATREEWLTKRAEIRARRS